MTEEQKQKAKDYQKRYYLEHKDSIKAWYKNYQKKNRTKINSKQREAYKRNPEKYYKRWKEWLKNKPDYYRIRYISHWRKAKAIKKYGVTAEEFDNILPTLLNGNCEICEEQASPTDSLCIDHNHVTKKFRGCICNTCNIILGMAKDNPDRLERAIKYLKEKDL